MSGIAIDSTGWVHQGSIFRCILAHALAPTGAHTRALYMRAFTFIAAHLHLYVDAVNNFDRESFVPFQAINNFTFPLYRLHIHSSLCTSSHWSPCQSFVHESIHSCSCIPTSLCRYSEQLWYQQLYLPLVQALCGPYTILELGGHGGAVEVEPIDRFWLTAHANKAS